MNTADGVTPDFIVIGAMKSGTTTLDRHLRAHPEIGMSRDKETNYFVAEKTFGNGPRWYSGQFDPARRLHGEASPNYAKVDVFKGVPERIAAHCDGVRLVYIVRDPVDRAVSQYRHSWTIGDIALDPEAFAGSTEWDHVVATSRYALQLEAYLPHVPLERILVLDFDDLVRDPQRTMDTLAAYLGVSPHPVAAGSHNEAAELSRVPAPVLRLAQSPLGQAMNRLVSRAARDRIRRLMARGGERRPPAFPAPVVDRLREALAPDAARLRALTGRTFPAWSV